MSQRNAIRAKLRHCLGAALALAVLPGAVQGCSGPTAPVPPPSGGATLDLDYALFAATVEPVLVRHGCDAGGDCHGGGIRGTLELSPPGAKDAAFDFQQVRLLVSPVDPDLSPILTEPLAIDAGGTPHSVKPFDSTSDSGYVAIRQWIVAGSGR